jgi:DNA-binding NarL/FixJ family response regulator
MPDGTRILIADDHDLFRKGLRFALEDSLPGAEVVAVGDFDTALETLASGRVFDLVSFDLSMPGMQGGASLRAIRDSYPDLRVVVISGDEDRATILSALEAGVHGYLPKSLSGAQIEAALKQVLAGSVFVPGQLARIEQASAGGHAPRAATPAADPAPQSNPTRDQMTPRQRDVLDSLLQGRSTKEICRDLGLAEGTVKIHLAAIFRLLGAKNRTEAVSRALTLDLGSVPPRHP